MTATGNEQEFYGTVFIFTVVFAGSLIVLALIQVVIAIKNMVNKKIARKEAIKQIYEQERQNGKSQNGFP